MNAFTAIYIRFEIWSFFCIFVYMQKEIWRAVPGYEGFYEVSSEGRVRSLDRWVKNPRAKSGYGFRHGSILTVGQDEEGYRQTKFCKEGTAHPVKIAPIVAKTFPGDMWRVV